MKPTLKMLIAAATILGASAAFVAPSSAAPISVMPQIDANPLLQDVRYGCGPGRHPNGWGRCAPNRRNGYRRGYRRRGW